MRGAATVGPFRRLDVGAGGVWSPSGIFASGEGEGEGEEEKGGEEPSAEATKAEGLVEELVGVHGAMVGVRGTV